MTTTTIDPDQPEPPTPLEHKYEVRFHIDVYAHSPEKAAEIARDMLLDPDTELTANVHQYEYYAPAEDWFPRENEGVWAHFGDRWPKHCFMAARSRNTWAPACGRLRASPGHERRRNKPWAEIFNLPKRESEPSTKNILDMTLAEMQAAGAAERAERRKLFEEAPDRKAAEEKELERLADLVEEVAWDTRMRGFTVVRRKRSSLHFARASASSSALQFSKTSIPERSASTSTQTPRKRTHRDGREPRSASDVARSVARHGGIAPTRWDRLTNDSYFTIDAPWIIPALLSKVKIVGPVLEPAAGVGHMVRELRRGHGLEVIASDLYAYEEPLIPGIVICDLRSVDLNGFRWAVTGPLSTRDWPTRSAPASRCAAISHARSAGRRAKPCSPMSRALGEESEKADHALP
jgi:hypothetical protein